MALNNKISLRNLDLRNLCSYIYKNHLFEMVDLVKIAREREEVVKIIVDTGDIRTFLGDIVLRKMTSNYSQNISMLPAGEYKEMENIFKDFHESHREIHVELIWVVNGPMHRPRYNKIIHKQGNMKMSGDQLKQNRRPVFYFDAAINKLKECGAKILQLIPEEENAMIVRIYRDEGAFAILSGDAEFVNLKNCNVILRHNLLKYYGDHLNLPFVNQIKGGRMFQAPITFECPLINSNDIIRQLQLQPLMAVDSTRPLGHVDLRNLCSYVYKKNLYKVVDLVSVGREHGEVVKIVVDTGDIGTLLIDIALKKLAMNNSSNISILPAGEYKEIENIFKDFHESLIEIHVELIWVLNGLDRVKHDKVIHKYGDKQRSNETLHKNRRPICYVNAALNKLKECGARIIHLPPGEENAMLVRIYRDEGAFAILSDDPEFLIFNNCDVILRHNLIKYNNGDFNLPFVNKGFGERMFEAPITFKCPLTNSKDIIRHLELTEHEQLMMVAVMVGNDYTRKFAKDVTTLCNVRHEHGDYPNWEAIAGYIKEEKITFESYERSFDLRAFVGSHPTFKEAVTKSRKMYLSDGSISYESSDELTAFLNRGLQSGDINRDCFTIHNGEFYTSFWRNELPEGCKEINETLQSLRAKVYPFLLKNDRDTINEEVTIGGDYIELPVVHADRRTHQISRMEGLDIFVRIFSEGFSDIFKGYIDELRMVDIPKLFVMCIISYFYKITHEVNLMVTESEFKAVFITAFFQFKFDNGDLQPILVIEKLMGLEICPSPRCATIAEWVMVLYKTAVNICGGALNITTLLPPPSTIMKGSVMIAFLETMDPDGQRTHHLDSQTLGAIKGMKEDVMVEFREIYDLITDKQNVVVN